MNNEAIHNFIAYVNTLSGDEKGEARYSVTGCSRHSATRGTRKREQR